MVRNINCDSVVYAQKDKGVRIKMTEEKENFKITMEILLKAKDSKQAYNDALTYAKEHKFSRLEIEWL